eukprot:g3639.t1
MSDDSTSPSVKRGRHRRRRKSSIESLIFPNGWEIYKLTLRSKNSGNVNEKSGLDNKNEKSGEESFLARARRIPSNFFGFTSPNLGNKEGSGTVVVEVIKCLDLPKQDKGGTKESDPYVVLEYGKQRFRTLAKKDTCNPEFYQAFTFMLDSLEELEKCEIIVTVMDSDFGTDDPMATTILDNLKPENPEILESRKSIQTSETRKLALTNLTLGKDSGVPGGTIILQCDVQGFSTFEDENEIETIEKVRVKFADEVKRKTEDVDDLYKERNNSLWNWNKRYETARSSGEALWNDDINHQLDAGQLKRSRSFAGFSSNSNLNRNRKSNSKGIGLDILRRNALVVSAEFYFSQRRLLIRHFCLSIIAIMCTFPVLFFPLDPSGEYVLEKEEIVSQNTKTDITVTRREGEYFQVDEFWWSIGWYGYYSLWQTLFAVEIFRFTVPQITRTKWVVATLLIYWSLSATIQFLFEHLIATDPERTQYGRVTIWNVMMLVPTLAISLFPLIIISCNRPHLTTNETSLIFSRKASKKERLKEAKSVKAEMERQRTGILDGIKKLGSYASMRFLRKGGNRSEEKTKEIIPAVIDDDNDSVYKVSTNSDNLFTSNIDIEVKPVAGAISPPMLSNKKLKDAPQISIDVSEVPEKEEFEISVFETLRKQIEMNKLLVVKDNELNNDSSRFKSLVSPAKPKKSIVEEEKKSENLGRKKLSSSLSPVRGRQRKNLSKFKSNLNSMSVGRLNLDSSIRKVETEEEKRLREERFEGTRKEIRQLGDLTRSLEMKFGGKRKIKFNALDFQKNDAELMPKTSVSIQGEKKISFGVAMALIIASRNLRQKQRSARIKNWALTFLLFMWIQATYYFCVTYTHLFHVWASGTDSAMEKLIITFGFNVGILIQELVADVISESLDLSRGGISMRARQSKTRQKYSLNNRVLFIYYLYRYVFLYSLFRELQTVKDWAAIESGVLILQLTVFFFKISETVRKLLLKYLPFLDGVGWIQSERDGIDFKRRTTHYEEYCEQMGDITGALAFILSYVVLRKVRLNDNESYFFDTDTDTGRMPLFIFFSIVVEFLRRFFIEAILIYRKNRFSPLVVAKEVVESSIYELTSSLRRMRAVETKKGGTKDWLNVQQVIFGRHPKKKYRIGSMKDWFLLYPVELAYCVLITKVILDSSMALISKHVAMYKFE